MEIDEGNEITPYSFEKDENMENMITCTVNWIDTTPETICYKKEK